MKKIYALMLALIACGVTLSAQNYTLTSRYNKTSDSVTNTGTNYLTATITGTASVVTVQLKVTKISGTGAGTATLQGSLDGVNFVTLHYVGGATTGVQNDTFTLTDVTTQSVTWVVTPSAYTYYRVSVTGSGTELIKLEAVAIQRKP